MLLRDSFIHSIYFSGSILRRHSNLLTCSSSTLTSYLTTLCQNWIIICNGTSPWIWLCSSISKKLLVLKFIVDGVVISILWASHNICIDYILFRISCSTIIPLPKVIYHFWIQIYVFNWPLLVKIHVILIDIKIMLVQSSLRCWIIHYKLGCGNLIWRSSLSRYRSSFLYLSSGPNLLRNVIVIIQWLALSIIILFCLRSHYNNYIFK